MSMILEDFFDVNEFDLEAKLKCEYSMCHLDLPLNKRAQRL